MPVEPEPRDRSAAPVFQSTARITGREQVLGVPPALEALSSVDFFASLPWEPPTADADRMTAEEFLLAL